MAVPISIGALFLPVIVVDDGTNGWSRVAFPGSQVTLSYVHSVEQTLVQDQFQVG